MLDSTKERLETLLSDVKHKTAQHPDFQRGWVRGDPNVRGLLASGERRLTIVTLRVTAAN